MKASYWNQAERTPASPAVVKAVRVGESGSTMHGSQLPPDTLSELLDGPVE